MDSPDSWHGSIDGACFGTSFPYLLFMICPSLTFPKTGPVETSPSRPHETNISKRNHRWHREEPEMQENVDEPASTAAEVSPTHLWFPGGCPGTLIPHARIVSSIFIDVDQVSVGSQGSSTLYRRVVASMYIQADSVV